MPFYADRKEIEEEELRVLAQFAASTLAKAEKKPYHDAVLNITEAHQQTVAVSRKYNYTVTNS